MATVAELIARIPGGADVALDIVASPVPGARDRAGNPVDLSKLTVTAAHLDPGSAVAAVRRWTVYARDYATLGDSAPAWSEQEVGPPETRSATFNRLLHQLIQSRVGTGIILAMQVLKRTSDGCGAFVEVHERQTVAPDASTPGTSIVRTTLVVLPKGVANPGLTDLRQYNQA